MKLGIKYLAHYEKEWGEAAYAHGADAGFDLRAAIGEPTVLVPGQVYLVPCGIVAYIPEGHELQIRPRSGLSKLGLIIPNAPGTVDAGFRGELKVMLYTLHQPIEMKPGDRIAQAILAPVLRAQFYQVADGEEPPAPDNRGAAGWGSTGTK